MGLKSAFQRIFSTNSTNDKESSEVIDTITKPETDTDDE